MGDLVYYFFQLVLASGSDLPPDAIYKDLELTKALTQKGFEVVPYNKNYHVSLNFCLCCCQWNRAWFLKYVMAKETWFRPLTPDVAKWFLHY